MIFSRSKRVDEDFLEEIKQSYRYYDHLGSRGDTIYSIPSIIAKGNGIMYLKKKDQYQFMRSLLSRQPCFIDVRGKHEHWEQYDYLKKRNLIITCDGWRALSDADSNKNIAVCHLENFGVTADLFKPWLFNIDRKFLKKIVIHRTTFRYRGNNINWSMLDRWKNDIVFVGCSDEYRRHEKRFSIGCSFYQVRDALELAEVIAGSKLFIGNQSLPYALAEGMKHPRCMEISERRNNCRFGEGNPNVSFSLTEEFIEKHMDS